MKLEEVAGILNAVDAEADVVGLAITEHQPWDAIAMLRSPSTQPVSGARASAGACNETPRRLQ
jgi:arginase